MQHIFLPLFLIASVTSLSFIHTQVDSVFLQSFRQAELTKHNEYRARHGSPTVALSESLNAAAQAYAEKLAAAKSGLKHSPAAMNGKYGQNLYWGWGYPRLNYVLGTASNSWYSEEKFYNYQTFKSNDPTKMVGHFTALVWKGVAQVGFGFARSDEKGGQAVYIVANYAPTPNVRGRYAENVLPKSRP